MVPRHFHYFISFFFLFVASCRGKFHVEKSGIFPVGLEDVGIRFYLQVVNDADYEMVVMKAKDPKCCWDVEVGDRDCDSMQLFGGFQLQIDKATSRNVTYVFPNIYPLDRIGVCTFFLKELDSTSPTLIHKISFDTSLDSEVTSLFEGGPLIYKQCHGIDENLRNNCYPFNCAKKYNGFRNFYRTSNGKCEPATKCSTRVGEDDLPTTAFDFENNRCKDLVRDLKKKEKNVADELLDKSPLKKKQKQYVDSEELIINCNNGVQKGFYCQCDEGWKTVTVTTKNGVTKKNWCSVNVRKNVKKSNRHFRLTMFIIFIGGCAVLLSLLLYLWWQLFVREIIPTHLNCTKVSQHDVDIIIENSLFGAEGYTREVPLIDE